MPIRLGEASRPPEHGQLRRAPGYDAFFDSPQKRRSSWDEPSRAQLLLDWFRQRA